MHSIHNVASRTIDLVIAHMPPGSSVLETALEMERQYPFRVHDGPERRIYSAGVDGYVRFGLDHTDAINAVLGELREIRRDMKRTSRRQAARVGHRLSRRRHDEGGERGTP